MKVKDLKEAIKNLSDNAEVILCGYDRKSGRTELRYTHRCCNFEHQEKVNELWLSQEGFKKG